MYKQLDKRCTAINPRGRQMTTKTGTKTKPKPTKAVGWSSSDKKKIKELLIKKTGIDPSRLIIL
tara:strand:- start:398 stop:589 length:192 start_codon:yes stop_codon:yes gene_type:complete